jgi:hypothetical protein
MGDVRRASETVAKVSDCVEQPLISRRDNEQKHDLLEGYKAYTKVCAPTDQLTVQELETVLERTSGPS